MHTFALRSSSRLLKGRTRTATLTLSVNSKGEVQSACSVTMAANLNPDTELERPVAYHERSSRQMLMTKSGRCSSTTYCFTTSLERTEAHDIFGQTATCVFHQLNGYVSPISRAFHRNLIFANRLLVLSLYVQNKGSATWSTTSLLQCLL